MAGAVLATQYSRQPQLTLAQRLDFAAQAIGSTSLEQTLALGNTGRAPLSIQGLSLAGSHPQDFLVDTADCAQAPIDAADFRWDASEHLLALVAHACRRPAWLVAGRPVSAGVPRRHA